MKIKDYINEAEAVIIVIVSGLSYLYLTTVNPYYDVDRHYYQNHRVLYYILKLAYVIIILSLVLNTKFVAMALVRNLFKFMASRLMR